MGPSQPTSHLWKDNYLSLEEIQRTRRSLRQSARHTSIRYLELHGTQGPGFEVLSEGEWLAPIVKHANKWVSLTSLTVANMNRKTRYSVAWKRLFDSENVKARVTQLTLGSYVSLGTQFLSSNSVEEVLWLLGIVSGFPNLRVLKMDPFGDEAKDVVNSGSDAEEEDEEEIEGEDVELGERVSLDEAEVLHLAESIGCAPVGLEELEMTGLHVPCNFPLRLLWEWLRVSKATVLRKLAIRLDYMDDGDLPAFGRYLQAAGGSLTHLTLALGLSGRDVGDMPEVMALEEARVQLRAILQSFTSHEVLAHSNGLESVSLELIYFYDIGNDRSLSLLSLEEMVKAIPGNSLKRLEIQVWTDLASDGDASEVEARKWKNGDARLADQDVFPELKEVVITVTVVEDINFTEYYSGEMDGLDGEDSTVNEGLISKRLELLFPKCLERGIVRFEHKPWC